MQPSARLRKHRVLCRLALGGVLLLTACTQVGPDFIRPEAQVRQQWMEADAVQVRTSPADYRMWWSAFRDPVLDRLVQTAYAQNIPLRLAGARVFEARAQLGIAIGDQYPQLQQAVGSAFDNALVTLTGDVAGTYVALRTVEERLRITQENVDLQKESLRIARARFEAGSGTGLDVQQALAQLRSTEAVVPQFEASIRQAQNALCVLLGVPPGSLDHLLGDRSAIPQAPLEVAVGIPADLLRRRPDIRSAELQAAAQCAQIGVAKADLYPAFTLNGAFGFLASDVGRFGLGDLTSWSSRYYSFGPSFAWNFLNYGPITNNVRAQDARFQELIFVYQNTVLRAQQEVEDALTGFLQARRSLIRLK